MSLTSYRAAPPRVNIPPTSEGARCSVKVPRCARDDMVRRKRVRALKRPGSDLLSRVLRHSTIGAEGFHGRVRNGIGCSPFATATRSFERAEEESPWASRPAADVDRCTEQHEIKPIELLVPLS